MPWLPRILGAALALAGVAGCPSSSTSDAPADLAVPAADDLHVAAGLFEDCTPAGWTDVSCQSGLRCGLVRLGDAPYEGTRAQCVPIAATAIAEGETCDFDQQVGSPNVGVQKRHDRCGAGLGCVKTPTKGLRCQKLCQLRVRGECGKDRYCVIPTDATGTGYCAREDRCQAVPPQSGCPRDGMGRQLGCYVLGDDKGAGAFCLSQEPYGDSSGMLDSACERSVNCSVGLGCITKSGRDAVCRPYCALPVPPDLGSNADGGVRDLGPPPDLAGDVPCTADLGLCRGISGYVGVGRCL